MGSCLSLPCPCQSDNITLDLFPLLCLVVFSTELPCSLLDFTTGLVLHDDETCHVLRLREGLVFGAAVLLGTSRESWCLGNSDPPWAAPCHRLIHPDDHKLWRVFSGQSAEKGGERRFEAPMLPSNLLDHTFFLSPPSFSLSEIWTQGAQRLSISLTHTQKWSSAV
jgi:hypothetical protein